MTGGTMITCLATDDLNMIILAHVLGSDNDIRGELFKYLN